MSTARYDAVAVALHWITAVAVIGLLGIGLWMTALPFGRLKIETYAWHKWIGLCVLALTLGRLVWRRWHPSPALPSDIPPWQQRAASAVHATLLLLLLAMPVSGWLMNSAAGVSLYWFALVPVPDLVARDIDLFEALQLVHRILSRLLIAFVVLHVAAVLKHDLLDRRGILRRMWFGAR